MVKFNSVFDVIGPVMVGPSSSHTAGAVRIAKIARDLFHQPMTWATIYLYGSFAKTYKGHGTDLALIGGLLGFDTNDTRMRQADELAEEKGLKDSFLEDSAATDHPNTVRMQVGNEKESMELVGISIGGGKVEIKELNGFMLQLSGNHPAILVTHNDRAGAIASVAQILAKYKVNIAHMEVNRKDLGKEALMIIETDQNMDEIMMRELKDTPYINQVSKIVT